VILLDWSLEFRMNSLEAEFESLGEIYWAYDFLKNVEDRTPEDRQFKRIEKALKYNLDALNDGSRPFCREYLDRSVLSYIYHRWGI
jgi:hypothetical protein